MKLYVMRHGPAEDFAERGRDFDRALTESGRERVRSVARALAAAGESPKVLLSSPLVRAKQTAELVLPTATDAKTVEIEDALRPGGAAAALARQLLRDGRRRVMVVGHEPDLSALVTELTGAAFGRDMLKAMVVGLRLTDGIPYAEMRFVLDPKSLEISR